MFKLQYNCSHFTPEQSNAENSPSQSSTTREQRTSRWSSWIQKRQNKRSNCQHPLDHKKSKKIPEKIAISVSLKMLMPLIVCITTNFGKFFKKWEYQTTLPASCKTCMQVDKQQLEPKTEQQTDWFQIGKRVRHGCILSSCLFNLHAEYIIQNAGLYEAQARLLEEI